MESSVWLTQRSWLGGNSQVSQPQQTNERVRKNLQKPNGHFEPCSLNHQRLWVLLSGLQMWRCVHSEYRPIKEQLICPQLIRKTKEKKEGGKWIASLSCLSSYFIYHCLSLFLHLLPVLNNLMIKKAPAEFLEEHSKKVSAESKGLVFPSPADSGILRPSNSEAHQLDTHQHLSLDALPPTSELPCSCSTYQILWPRIIMFQPFKEDDERESGWKKKDTV